MEKAVESLRPYMLLDVLYNAIKEKKYKKFDDCLQIVSDIHDHIDRRRQVSCQSEIENAKQHDLLYVRLLIGIKMKVNMIF